MHETTKCTHLDEQRQVDRHRQQRDVVFDPIIDVHHQRAYTLLLAIIEQERQERLRGHKLV